jgi:hypothetical protein
MAAVDGSLASKTSSQDKAAASMAATDSKSRARSSL